MKNKDSQRNDDSTQSATSLVPTTPSTPLAHPVSGLPDDTHYDVPSFDPVPVQPLYKGWTPTRSGETLV